MEGCCPVVEQMQNALSCPYYGEQGCTAAPLSTSQQPGSSQKDTATGSEPKQRSGSGLKCQTMKLDLSPDASMQDLYLILSALYDGGFDVSVSVQATPSKESAPSPSDTAEQCGSLMEVCPLYESPMQWAALWACLRSTTPSSKQSASSMTKQSTASMQGCNDKPGCLGKLQEGRE